MGLIGAIFGSRKARSGGAPVPPSLVPEANITREPRIEGRSRGGRLHARYDAAATNDDNRRHWANADGLAPDAGANPEIRRVLRNRGRYEQFNNPYTDGILQTLASDTVGRTPRLKMMTGDDRLDAYVEREVKRYAQAVQLGKLLRIAVENACAAGEVFCLMGKNKSLEVPVRLGLTLIEAEQVTTPTMEPINRPGAVDGIVFDEDGNPQEYHVLRHHPGDTAYYGALPGDYDRIPAEFMIHLFKQRRPGQRRGIPRITSSLPLFAERRNYRQSVMAAARSAAELGAVMLESTFPPETGSGETTSPNSFDTMEIERGSMTALPDGYKASQMKAEQPGTTYKEFDDKLVNESARPLNMPKNIAACDSSGYNYSSGRLDHQTYDRAIDVDREDIELGFLDRSFYRWIEWALTIPTYLPHRARSRFAGGIAHEWLWDGREHVDPVKEAQGQKIRIASGTASLSDELARDGRDLEEHLAKRQRERDLMSKMGLLRSEPLAGPQATAAADVLLKVGQRLLAPEAGVLLLVSLGFDETKAQLAVDKTMALPRIEINPPDSPAPSPAPSRNGTHGVHATNGKALAGGRLAVLS